MRQNTGPWYFKGFLALSDVRIRSIGGTLQAAAGRWCPVPKHTGATTAAFQMYKEPRRFILAHS